MGYAVNGMYYGGMGGAEMAPETGSPIDWILIAVIAVSIILGIIGGIILGKKAMKKRDI